MRWVIFCWSTSTRPPEGLRADDVIVCADSGLEYALRCGLTPSLVLGDFDSYTGEVPSSATIVRLPREKDDTDAMYAARLGLEQGVREFLIAGGIGGRLDHTLGALQTLNFLVSHGASAVISDGEQSAEVLQAPFVRRYPRKGTRYFSVLALSPEAAGVTLEGFRYPLKNAVLTYDFPLAVSNEIVADEGVFSAQSGRVAVIRSEDG